MKYIVRGYDKDGKIIKAMIHDKPIKNGVVKNAIRKYQWLYDFYCRYIMPLDKKTLKRNDRMIILKKPIENIIKIEAKNLDEKEKTKWIKQRF